MNPDEREDTILNILLESLELMSPEHAVRHQIGLNQQDDDALFTIFGNDIKLDKSEKIWVIGSGKASVAMARAVEEILEDRIADGMVIAPQIPSGPSQPKRIQVLKGSHPIPDKESLSSTFELIEFAKHIPRGSIVLSLISGGTSALLCMPGSTIEIEDMGILHDLLLESGMDIHQMNTIRKTVSEVKAGGLLRHLNQTRLFDLVISDVPGDLLASIGSGPTCFEQKDFEGTFQLLKQYKLWDKVPHTIRAYIAKGMKEQTDTQPPELLSHSSTIVSSAGMLARKIADKSENAGYETEIIDPAYNHPIEEVEQHILKTIRNQPENGKKCFVFYGESSVKVTGGGKGGRNQELALRLSRFIQPDQKMSIACMGTDGVDGPTDAAGAIVDETTLSEANKKNLDMELFLKNNDSWNFFNQAGGHIKTGPTGNNLMDVVVVLVDQN